MQRTQQPRVRSFSFLNPLQTHQPQDRGPAPKVFGSTSGRYVKSDNQPKEVSPLQIRYTQRDPSVSLASTDLEASYEATCFVGNRSLKRAASSRSLHPRPRHRLRWALSKKGFVF